MGSSAVRSFSDPDEYDRAVRAGDLAGLRRSRGGFRAELTRVDLGSVWMQRFQENTPCSMRCAAHSSRSVILFRTQEGDTAFRHRGIDFDDDTIMFLGAGVVDSQSSDGPIGFGTMSLSPADLARFGPLLAERDLVAPRATTMLRPQPAAFARLRFLHGAAAHLARADPARLEDPEVARALEDSLISAMVRCLAEARPVHAPLAGNRRAALVRRMDEHLEAHDDFPIYITDLCQALGVTERSLERACQDQLGIGPKRYLWLRRLHLARRALMQSDPSHTTVSKVALAHGFWELGRFAVRYHQIFGEPPSTTLRGLRARSN
jgi:AraC-like DNA-binding protein